MIISAKENSDESSILNFHNFENYKYYMLPLTKRKWNKLYLCKYVYETAAAGWKEKKCQMSLLAVIAALCVAMLLGWSVSTSFEEYEMLKRYIKS